MTKREILQDLIDLVAVNDLDLLDLDGHLPSEICSGRDRNDVVRRAGARLQQLWRSFDYVHCPEFKRSIQGKSEALRAMRTRLESEPVRRVKHRDRYEDALARLLDEYEAYSLTDQSRHQLLDEVRLLIDGLSNLASG